ncbi:MAG: GNAT family N-acetyltransferase [Nitrospirae bacterium]|nr:MAG: GNAT family N-acetyltransferase [Nitrospirota bacterium]
MNDVSVRPALADEVPALCRLLSELFEIEADFSPDAEKQARGLELLLNDENGSSIVLVAEKNGEIIGMCSAQTVISTSEGGPAGLLEDLIVSRAHRGKGTGARLLAAISAWGASRNISRIQLLRDMDNAQALDFYHTNGWNSTKLVCMRKFL